MIFTQDDGTEIEVVPVADMEKAVETAKNAIRDEFGNIIKQKDALIGNQSDRIKGFIRLTDKQKEDLTATEKIAYDNAEKLHAEQESAKEWQKNSILSQMTGGDKEMIEKVKQNMAILQMPEGNPDELVAKVTVAMKIAGQEAPNPLAVSHSFGMGAPMPNGTNPTRQKSYADTEEGKGLANALGLALEAPKK